MVKKIERPSWYQEEFYNKKRTPEEWLYEIWKRDKFNRDELGLPVSFHLLPLDERKKCFLEIIFLNDIQKFLSDIKSKPAKPIQHLSVSDVFHMFLLIKKSDWYRNHPDTEIFENTMTDITNNKKLTKDQSIVFERFFDTPWFAFHENSQDNLWFPNKDIAYLSGIPLSLDPGYAKAETAAQLKTYLSNWVGKLQDIELKFNLWQESKILAVFDLMVWFKIQSIKYTNIGLHRLLWPKGRFSSQKNEYVNPDDDIDYIVSLSERVINRSVIRTLLSICKNRKDRKQTKHS